MFEYLLFSMPVVRTVWRRDKELNKELPEDDLIEDRNMLECFLKCLSDFNIT